MSNRTKKAVKRKKQGQSIKKKKNQLKKLGLAKYIQPDSRPEKKISAHNDGNNKNKGNNDKRNGQDVEQKKAVIHHLKSEQKNLSLIDRAKLQMSSSLLRLIDEDIYTSDTKNIPLNKDKFLAYHEAYASVCEKWPTKPIDYIVKFIKKRLLSKKSVTKYKFADIGCGKEPLLKMKLPPRAKVLSFDLVSTHEGIIEANMEKLPIDSESIHCTVYSLSLMAKNLGNILLEGKRILKLGGSMVIVEVTSRFEGKEKRFIGKLDRLGLKYKSSTPLKPNGYFTFFHFTKADAKIDYSVSALNIELKPCVYKAR